MDLNFYPDLSDASAQHGEAQFLDSETFGGYDVGEFPGSSDNYLTITGAGHTFLASSETFHTPSLGDEEFEIPPISLDPDSALTVSDVVSHFGELTDSSMGGDPTGADPCVRSAVVEGNDPSFASPFVNNASQSLSLGVMSQSAGGTLLSSAMGMDLAQSIGSHFSSSSPMTIDVPLNDINHSLLGHNQLTTIDQSELSAQLGLSLGGGTILPRTDSPEQPLSATGSPEDSLQEDEIDDFRQNMLVDSPVSLSASPAVISISPSLSGSPLPSSSLGPPVLLPSVVRRVGGKPAMVSAMGMSANAAGGVAKKGKKKKDPNEPQKPVSAYALFFRDTQAAIKGQNPNATFGEVSKIVASMWDSLGEEQKQVYRRKTEAAKKDYLKALAAYRANQLSQAGVEVMDTAVSSPPSASTPPPATAPSPSPTPPPPPAPARPTRAASHIPEQNTITNICASNIIMDAPQVTTRSRTGANRSAAVTPNITKIFISKEMLTVAGGAHVSPIQPVFTVIPARQPPPLLQMQHAPPRLQQMVHSPAPPPLQAKPRGVVMTSSVTLVPPPPLHIKIVPNPLQAELPIIVTNASSVPAVSHSAPALEVQVAEEAAIVTSTADHVVEEFASGEMEVELNVCPGPDAAPPGPRCIRAGCTNPPVESKDWDKEYCSNECVATHCRDVFMAWCSIRGQNSTTTVK